MPEAGVHSLHEVANTLTISSPLRSSSLQCAWHRSSLSAPLEMTILRSTRRPSAICSRSISSSVAKAASSRKRLKALSRFQRFCSTQPSAKETNSSLSRNMRVTARHGSIAQRQSRIGRSRGGSADDEAGHCWTWKRRILRWAQLRVPHDGFRFRSRGKKSGHNKGRATPMAAQRVVFRRPDEKVSRSARQKLSCSR